MQIIRPYTITESVVTSDVAITETLWTAGTYTAGDQRYYGIILYEAISTTTDRPDIGAALATPTWLNIGNINKFKMFDGKTDSPTTDTTEMVVSVELAGIVNAVACLNLLGQTIKVDVIDSVDGNVYSETKTLIEDLVVTNWYQYFFEPYSLKPDIVFLDLPAYPAAEVKLTLTGSGAIEFGEAVLGQLVNIGTSVFGTSVGINDYSRKDTDDFGNFIITERRYSKKADFDVVIEPIDVTKAQLTLASLRATPAVYVGTEEYQSTIIYGFYSGFNIILSNYAIAEATITIEGL